MGEKIGWCEMCEMLMVGFVWVCDLIVKKVFESFWSKDDNTALLYRNKSNLELLKKCSENIMVMIASITSLYNQHIWCNGAIFNTADLWKSQK